MLSDLENAMPVRGAVRAAWKAPLSAVDSERRYRHSMRRQRRLASRASFDSHRQSLRPTRLVRD